MYLFQSRFREPVVKVKNFYEETVPDMQPRIFRRYFRMFPQTFTSVCDFLRNVPILDQELQYTRIPTDKKIAMTCAYLGSKLPLLQ